MDWDRNEGRYTCIMAGGVVAHAARTAVGWEVLVPAAGIHEVVRNARLKTWLSAQSVVERLIRARLAGHHDLPDPLTHPSHEVSELVSDLERHRRDLLR